jgi:methyl-accepting chemotaxis protein
MMMTVSGIATGINDWDDANVRVLRSATRMEDIASMDARRQSDVLHALGDTYEWAFVIYTIDHNGDNLARSDGKPLINFADRSYFKGAMRGEPVNRQVLISKTTGKPALTLALPIRNAIGEPAGAIAMAMKLDDISKVIKDTRIGETGYALLLDADHKVIATGMKGGPGDAVQDMANHPALKVDGISDAPAVYRRDDGKRLVSYVHKLPQGWTLIVEQDYAEAYAQLERLEMGARLLMILTAALVIVIASVLGKALTRPINQLIAITEQLSRGQFQDAIPETGRGDEIGALARAIERLGVSIRMAMDRLRRKA